jgi:hypothetical protein
MTTQSNPIVTVDPITQLVSVCAWCLSAQQLQALGRAYRCTHGLCKTCIAAMEAEAA